MYFMRRCIFIFIEWEINVFAHWLILSICSHFCLFAVELDTNWALRFALNYSVNDNSSLNVIRCTVVSGVIVDWETVWRSSNSSSLLAYPQMLRVMLECMVYQIYSTEAALCDSLWWQDGAPSCSFSSLAGSLEIRSHYSWKRMQTYLAPFSSFPHALTPSLSEFLKRLRDLFSMALH